MPTRRRERKHTNSWPLMEETGETATPYETRVEDLYVHYLEPDPDLVSYSLYLLRQEQHEQSVLDRKRNSYAKTAAYKHGQTLYTLRISLEVDRYWVSKSTTRGRPPRRASAR